MKKIVVLIVLILLFSVSVSATENIYEDTASELELEQLEDILPDEVKDFFRENDININDSEWNKNLDTKSVFSHIFSFIKTKGVAPMRALALIAGVMIFSAVVDSFATQNTELTSSLQFIFAVIVSLSIADGVISVINAAVNAIHGTATFMLSFIPVYSGIVLLSGSPSASFVSGGLMLLAAEAIVQVSSFIIVPLMCAYFGLGLASGVSPLIADNGLTKAVKNIALWLLALTFTVFAGLLAIQTTFSSAADTVGTKTAKFFISSFVPVAGPALSEALNVVTTSVSLLKSSVGIYAVVAIALILIPIIIELVLWRVVISLSSGVANIFSLKSVGVLKAVDSLLSVLIGMILFVGAIFIISIAILIKR